MITESQIETFRERGLIRIEKLIPDATVTPVREMLLRALEGAGVLRDGEWAAEVTGDWGFRSRVLGTSKRCTKNSPTYKKLVTADLLRAIDGLVGGRPVKALTNRPQILCTPPDATTWQVPHKLWHTDLGRLPRTEMPGVQMFSFLSPVPSGAGGTLVVAGSHRLLNDRRGLRAARLKKLLMRDPWFEELFKPGGGERRHFLDEPTRVGDVEVQVVELCGEPGDVFLIDLRLLHTMSPNTSGLPRMMVTQRFYLESLMGEVLGTEDAAE